MDLIWYLSRLSRMSPAEIGKRLAEQATTLGSRYRFRDPGVWPYGRFAPAGVSLRLQPLPAPDEPADCRRYRIYDREFDVTQPVDSLYPGEEGSRWPALHSSRIDFRPGNPHGDVRLNWELNRLQFLPSLVQMDQTAAGRVLAHWLDRNRYCHGPAYLSSMEVALRWISVYRALCLWKGEPEPPLLREATGLAVASGNFISRHLSTHSSAGNHLIVEAVGLFWLGKALEGWGRGQEWLRLGRRILHQQIERQICPDGSGREQSFWYLGFVLDAVLHYLLLEQRSQVPDRTLLRILQAFRFVRQMILPDGSFPDYGDRDDGYVNRATGDYRSPFPALLQAAGDLGGEQQEFSGAAAQGSVTVFPDGGMTLMRRGKGRLLLRHAPLGLPPTYGHGHADALSVLFFWDGTPVLIDPGSGQYNGDPEIRRYFRSTLAHNTVQVGGEDQAQMLGPFLWGAPYHTSLESVQEEPHPAARASHDGYRRRFGVLHSRQIDWVSATRILIQDSFAGAGRVPIAGAFHFGACRSCSCRENVVTAQFTGFSCSLTFPAQLSVTLQRGALRPFFGWRGAIYGRWEPIFAAQFAGALPDDQCYTLILDIVTE